MVRRLLVILGALSACELEPLDVTGRRCDATRSCPEGLECVLGVCAEPKRDGGGRMDAGDGINLLRNPGFEETGVDGGLAAWRTAPGQLHASPVRRSGLRGARVQTGGPQTPSLFADPVLAGGLDAYCARAWIRADVDAGYQIALQVRERLSDGGIHASNATGYARTRPGNEWFKLVESFEPFGDELEVRIFAPSRIDAGEAFYVDDVELVRTPQSSLPCMP